jgi:starch-binding outer membrane protein, SusD/RagB family
MKNKFLSFMILGMASLFLHSCTSNIELEPFTALDASTGFKTRQDVEAAILGSYNSLQNANYYGLRIWALDEIYSGTLTHTGTFPSFAQFATKALLANNTETTNVWNTIYAGINRTNNVIASAPSINDPAFLKENAIAEARFLRGFHYFNLLTHYGGKPEGFNKGGVGVPIFLTPTLTSEDAAPKARATEADVWKVILEDVDYAITNLRDNNGIGRVNKMVATAMKARMHLMREEWQAAADLALTVINSKRYTLLPGASYENIYLNKNSTEAIWELQYDINNVNAIAFHYYPTANGGRNEVTSATALRNLHEANDLRLKTNVTTGVPANKTLKFTRVAGDDNVQILRLSEMHLIRAEALARLNKDIDVSLVELNTVRKRAGLADFTDKTPAKIVEAVLKERIIEFAHEGHRWMDIRRTNAVAANGFTQVFRALWPIPEREVDTSGKLIAQNDQY